MPKQYSSLQEIVDQLEWCGYETSDQHHNLENNTAFIALKERAAAEQGECAKLQSGEAPVQQLKAEIRAIAGRCTIPEKSFRHYYISIADYERLLELSAV